MITGDDVEPAVAEILRVWNRWTHGSVDAYFDNFGWFLKEELEKRSMWIGWDPWGDVPEDPPKIVDRSRGSACIYCTKPPGADRV